MLLRELFENAPNNVAIMFGRFNPPHFGHVAAWEVAAGFPIWFVGTNQSTQGPKDPLPFNIKIEAMKTLYPDIDDHLVAEQSWFTLAVMVFKKYGENTILHIVTDNKDKDIYVPMIIKQNGLEGPHGYYKFAGIEWAEAERKSEASLVRKAVKENNPQDFEKYSGVPANTKVAGQSYFELVKKYMLPYMQAEEEKLKKQQEREKEKIKKELKKKEKTEEPVGEARRTNIGQSLARQIDQYERRQGLVPLSDIEFKISKYLDTHIDAYQQGKLDADTLGEFLNKVKNFAVRKYNMDPTAVKTVIDYYVNNKITESLKEAAYKGNIGIMELFKFFNEAKKNNDFELIDHVKKLIQDKENLKVWTIIQDYLGTKLIGKEFGN